MVMAFHFVGHHGESTRLVQAAVVGQTGVDLFFVLSGFLITRILLLSKDSPHFFRTFYARRTLRIFPLYYAFLVAFFFVLPAICKTRVTPLKGQIWAWCYLQNLPNTFPTLQSSGPGHFWSLAVEEHFYLVWPILVFLLPRKHFTKMVYAVLIIAVLLRFLLLHLGIGVFYFTFTRMDSLGYGALLAVLLSNDVIDPARYLYLFRSLLIVLAVLLLPSFTLLSGSRLDWLQAVKLSLIPAFYFALLGFCIVDPMARPLVALLSLPWLRWLGAISYGLYVFHPTCFALVERFVAPSSFALDVLLSFSLTILIAFLSFRFFESPLLRFKRYFHYETVRA
jgi:peptidoglycan/LPS O-acetylase OafA/YrhL